MTEQHTFEFNLKNIDRNTKKADYKAISQWLRVTRNKIEQQIDFSKMYVNLACYGQTGIEYNG